MESFKNILEAKGIKPTYIRLKVLSFIERNKIHPTAETIFEELINEIPTISRTTVYNTLHIFSEKGITMPINISGTEARFDSNISPHHHFFCEKCGQIIDIDIECRYFKKGSVLGHRINELHGYFKGVCKECLKKEAH